MKLYKQKFKSVFMESFVSDLKKSMNQIYKILKSYNIKFIFLGGATLPFYGYLRTTEDIDILVSKSDKSKFESLIGKYLKRAFSGASRTFIWNDPRTKMDVLYSGDEKQSLEYEEPKKIGYKKEGLPFITLENLIKYKLAANRYIDKNDIEKLIIKNNLQVTFADDFRKDLKLKYKKIWDKLTKSV